MDLCVTIEENYGTKLSIRLLSTILYVQKQGKEEKIKLVTKQWAKQGYCYKTRLFVRRETFSTSKASLIGSSLCSRLQLHEVLSAYQKIASVKVAQYLGSADVHGRRPVFSRDSTTFDKCLYHVQLRTVPGKGLFEASVSFDGDKYQVIGEISRINLYGEQPRCILDKSPHLRKYCLCKDYEKHRRA